MTPDKVSSSFSGRDWGQKELDFNRQTRFVFSRFSKADLEYSHVPIMSSLSCVFEHML